MKKIAILLVTISLLAVPLVAQAQTTNTAFQVLNLNSTEEAAVSIAFYNTSGTVVYTLNDTISAGSSKTYIQANMGTELGGSFNGSVVISSNQQVAAVVNQSTSNVDATVGYNASYTGFSEGNTDFYLPIILNAYYGFHTEVSIQNAGSSDVDVTVTYDTPGCTDTASSLKPGAAVRFDNTSTCSGGLNSNGSATISATGGPVVAIVNQIGESLNMEQAYNGFAPTDGASTLYAPVVLYAYYTFYSAFQVQNISGSTMDICATYSDGYYTCKTSIADGESATFIQNTETHSSTWTGSAVVTNTIGGDMVAIVNQQGGVSAASYNAYAGGSPQWALPSLLYQYYGFSSAYQCQNVSSGAVDIAVTYDDGASASASSVAAGDTATFIQAFESGHTANQAFSAIVTATGGDIVCVVNQDKITAGAIDYMYSYNAVDMQ